MKRRRRMDSPGAETARRPRKEQKLTGFADSEREKRAGTLLAALRNAHEHMRGVFRHGGCYELFRILRTIEPDAEPWFIDEHIYTRIGNRWYDIDGEWTPTEDETKRLEPLFRKGRTPWTWRNRTAEARRGFQGRLMGTVVITRWLRMELALKRIKVRLAALLLPARVRHQVFKAMMRRAEADAVQVYHAKSEQARLTKRP